MTNRDALIEAMARAMCEHQDQEPDRALESVGKDGKPVIMWTHWKGEATAALTALEASGVRLVPVEATWPMVQAAHGTGTDRAFDLSPPEWHDAYNAMVAASPFSAEKETGHE